MRDSSSKLTAHIALSSATDTSFELDSICAGFFFYGVMFIVILFCGGALFGAVFFISARFCGGLFRESSFGLA